MPGSPVRLQRYLAACGICSRRAAEQLIRERRVTVNGSAAELGSSVDPLHDRVAVDGREVAAEQREMLLFHKPRGMITTIDDPQGRPCVGDVVRLLPKRMFPIGRLDADVSGLLLLTNDGAYAQNISHPRYGVERLYWAIVEGTPGSEALGRLRSGVELDDGPARAAAADSRLPDAAVQKHFSGVPENCSFLELRVAEGRKHFVKRLLAAVGHPVKKLSRIGFGPYRLGDLQPGELRKTSFLPIEQSPGAGARGGGDLLLGGG